MRSLAIILAAGRGSRMGSEMPKQYIMIHGKPLFLHSVQTFVKSSVDEIALVVAKNDVDYVKGLLSDLETGKKIRIVAGGAERFHSVYFALCAYREEDIDIVSIHDSARPAVSLETIEQSLQDAASFGASAVAVPSKDTVKLVDEDGFARETPSREEVYIVQTPQSFDYKTLLNAYDDLMKDESLQVGITDDAMVLERVLCKKVKITKGDYSNIKVTTKEDIGLIQSFLSSL